MNDSTSSTSDGSDNVAVDTNKSGGTIASENLIRNRLAAGRESPLKTYMSLTVGDVGKGRFILYELLMMFVAPMPGGLGYLLRKKLYPRLFGGFGRGIIIGRNVTIRHPDKIFLADGVTIDDNVVIDGRGAGEAGLRLEEGVILNRNVMVLAKNGGIRFGERTTIGANSVIVAMGGVDIGPSVMLAGGCYLSAGAYQIDGANDALMDNSAYSEGPIVLGEGAWLGTGAIVLDGAKIGDGTVIGAGAVVVNDIPANSIALGSPAKVHRERTPGVDVADTLRNA